MNAQARPSPETGAIGGGGGEDIALGAPPMLTPGYKGGGLDEGATPTTLVS